MNALCNRHIGLQYTDKEYRKKLTEFLLTFKTDIINNSKEHSDINFMVRLLLKQKISLFEQKNFSQYYHLDTVRVALAQFKNYFSFSNSAIQRNRSVYENEGTLARKTDYINRCIAFAENEELPIENRLAKIQETVKDPNFERVVLAHKKADYWSFTYLIQCFVSLLEALHLYTPTRKALYKGLNEAVNKPPQINELINRFGLFALCSSYSCSCRINTCGFS